MEPLVLVPVPRSSKPSWTDILCQQDLLDHESLAQAVLFWGCWCFSTRENVQAYAVCSQRLWVAVVNDVSPKAPAVS